jgi:hypothetical protein
MRKSLFAIAGQANLALIFNQAAAELGFISVGEIDRFVFSAYAKAIKGIRPADRLRGAIFVLEPATVDGVLADPSSLRPLLMQIRSATTSTLHSLRIDLNGGLGSVYICTSADRKSLVSGGWSQQVAQQFSRANKKCVAWAMGVGILVFINGDLYLESPDVVEELPSGLPAGFQSLSWNDGSIVFEFADCNLNDRGALGIWQLPDIHLLRPRPEILIRGRFGDFLRFRLAGYRHHDEEPHVENEGRADISLHLIDGRILIVEIKWIGCSLVGTHIGATEDAIKKAIKKKTRGWLTKFDEVTIASGVRQLVRYYKTGRYNRAYLTVFDCTASAKMGRSCYVPVPITELKGHSDANFRILRACVDPRPASKRAR